MSNFSSKVIGGVERGTVWIGEIVTINNHGFEIWTSATAVNDWSKSASQPPTTTREATEVHAGEYSCKLTGNAGGDGYLESDDLTVTVGQEYKVLVARHIPTASTLDADNAVKVYEKENGTWALLGTGTPTLNDEWEWLMVDFTPNYATIRIRVYSKQSEDSYVDSVVLLKLDNELNLPEYHGAPLEQWQPDAIVHELFYNREEKIYDNGLRYFFTAHFQKLTPSEADLWQELVLAKDVILQPHTDVEYYYWVRWDRRHTLSRLYVGERFSVGHRGSIALKGVELIKDTPYKVAGVQGGGGQMLP